MAKRHREDLAMEEVRLARGTWKGAAARFVPLALVTGGLLGAASVPMQASASIAQKKVAVVHTIKSAKYGTILVNAKGFALYTYDKDRKNHSVVTGQLLSFWPALVVAAGVTPVGTGVTGLGVAVRSNGQHQVTFHGKPLYTFVSDTKAGQVTGQGVNGFAIAAVGSTASTSSTSTTSSGGYSY
jgi:predicted lipoprotein with Yx(FWY)xxD motif